MVRSSFLSLACRVTFFSVVILLSTGLRAQLTVTLTGSMHNGSGVPCFGMQEGTIQSAVSGGTAPYSYAWSNGKTTASITDVAAGYYELKVIDALGATGESQFTLTEPEPLAVSTTPYKYPSGLNISCYECYNGSIDLQVEHGTPPYSYVWDDGPVATQDRAGLGAKSYVVIVTDANGCAAKAVASLTQPERSDWTMTGNAGTNPATQYIGTSDNKDVVFKANGQEAIRLKGNGNISLLGSLNEEGPLFRSATGELKVGDPDDWPTLDPILCRQLRTQRYWKTVGNGFSGLCSEEIPKLGSLTNIPLRIITNGIERIHVTGNGKVGIGTNAPENALVVSSDAVRSGIDIDNNSTGDNSSANNELRFMKNGVQRWAIGSDFSTNGSQDFYIWDHVAEQNRFVINSEGKVGIGLMPPTNQSIYKFYVEGGITCRDVLVKTGQFPDYVFHPTYDLMGFDNLRAFLARNKHLPGIPSAKEIEANEGVALGDLQVRMLKVIEEQTLYILQLEKRLQHVEGIVLEAEQKH